MELGSLRKLKERALRLLREDEEFRYAVIGLLGLSDLRKSIDEKFGRLEDALNRLAEAQRRTGHALRGLAVQVGRLSETIGL